MSSHLSPRSLSLLPPSLSLARRPSLLRPLPCSAPSLPPCTGEHPRRLLEFAAAHGPTAEGQGQGAAYPRRRSGELPLLPPCTTDDLFAHGRILPAYPVFDRHLLDRDGDGEAPAAPQAASSSTAPPSPDTYCAWAPRSAPGSPERDPGPPPFPKSASTGEARRFWRLRGLVSGGAGRSHSDGKEKFVFLQQPAAKASAPAQKQSKKKFVFLQQPAAKASAPAQKQSKKKSGKAAAGAVGTEMDMATAHKLFYGKPAGDRRHQQQQQSYLPYRPGIVGFFTPAHALGRSHHPY